MIRARRSLKNEYATWRKQSRWLKTLAAAALALAGVAFLAGPSGRILPGELRLSRTLEAEAFTLRDGKGRTRGTMTVQNERPILKLYDSAANELVVLGGMSEGGGLWLSDSHHRELVSLAAALPALILQNPNGKTSVQLVADAEYPRLWMRDSQGNLRAELEVSGEQASTLELSGSNGNGEAELQVARIGERLRKLAPGQEYNEGLRLWDERSTARLSGILLKRAGAYSQGRRR
jgi:hypothetical protein